MDRIVPNPSCTVCKGMGKVSFPFYIEEGPCFCVELFTGMPFSRSEKTSEIYGKALKDILKVINEIRVYESDEAIPLIVNIIEEALGNENNNTN